MCFSPTVSFTAGIGLTAIGCAAIAKTERKSEIFFAAIPLLFGMQQLTEGVVWLTVGTSSKLLSIATFVYLLFSNVLWPTLLPLSVFLIEPVAWRRRIVSMLIVLGAAVSSYFLYYVLTEPAKAEVVGQCIVYSGPHLFLTFLLSPYSAAVCAGCLFSSYRTVKLAGLLVFLAELVTLELFQVAFVSVWCFFSALVSAVIYLHFYFPRKRIT